MTVYQKDSIISNIDQVNWLTSLLFCEITFFLLALIFKETINKNFSFNFTINKLQF